MSANAFKILEVSGAADEPLAGAGWPPRGLKPGAGDPSGVVDSTSVQDMLDLREREREGEVRKGVLLGGAVNFCRNEESMGAGKVWPRSQISMSFLIFS
jgi:hypothetical protein